MNGIPKGIERIRTLYAVMAGIPAEKVNLGTWRSSMQTNELLESCGTTGCAVGWACAYPPFQAQGLDYWYGPRLVSKLASGSEERIGQWPAVVNFFDVSLRDAYALFLSMGTLAKEGDYYRYMDGELIQKIKDAGRHRHEGHRFARGCKSIGLSDRQIVLMRLRNYLHATGYISTARRDELKLQEEQGKIQFVETVTAE